MIQSSQWGGSQWSSQWGGLHGAGPSIFRLVLCFNFKAIQCKKKICRQIVWLERKEIRYVHLNPVEAGLTTIPEDFHWSSHRAYLGPDSYTWLFTQRVLERFDNDPADAIENLTAFVHRKVEAEIDLESISQAASIGVYGRVDAGGCSSSYLKSHGTISRLASRGEQRCDLVGIARSILKPKKQN